MKAKVKLSCGHWVKAVATLYTGPRWTIEWKPCKKCKELQTPDPLPYGMEEIP